MKERLPIAVAIVIGATLIAAAIAFTNRWEVVARDNHPVIRLDRWTGEIWACGVTNASFAQAMDTYTAYNYRCTPATPEEIKAAKSHRIEIKSGH